MRAGRELWWAICRPFEAFWSFWRYRVPHGIGNLIAFAPVIWEWRGWDFTYTYELAVQAWERQADHVARNKNHTSWAETEDEIRRAVSLYREYEAADARASTLADMERVNEKWAELHDHLAKHSRKWWD